MSDHHTHSVDRRLFLGTAAVAGTALALTRPTMVEATDAPKVQNPRATSGDIVSEPNWSEKLTMTVGPKTGVIVGSDDKAIQAAIDYVARYGGGTVQLSEGTFRLRNAVTLCSGVRLIGRGPETVLMKEPSIKSKLLLDSDWFDQEITLADAKGFAVGDGICLRAKNPHHGGATVIKRTLIARSGNRFKLDRPLRDNLWLMGEAYASTLFPLVTGENIHDLVIAHLTLDGNRANNDPLDGNYAGCIFLQDCRQIHIHHVVAQHNNGDGISWQICHDVTVEECVSHGHAGLGLHPGSGSQRPLIRRNQLHHNGLGLFFCWGVKYGLAEHNVIEDNSSYGISVGHRDTENLIVDNIVKRSGKAGVIFRAERGKAFAGHRNTLERNTIIDSGGDDGVSIDVEGETDGLIFTDNVLRETRAMAKRIGFRFGPKTGTMTLKNNTIEGFATAIADQRKK